MKSVVTADAWEDTQAEVLTVYHRYVDAFNRRDLVAAVDEITFPCSDLRTVEGVPVQFVYADAAAMRKYFTSVVERLTSAGWQGTSRLLRVIICPFGERMVTLLSDFERRTAAGELMGVHRVFYNLVHRDGAWKIIGYVTPDAGYLGPGHVPLTA